jgi:hypothetical protein
MDYTLKVLLVTDVEMEDENTGEGTNELEEETPVEETHEEEAQPDDDAVTVNYERAEILLPHPMTDKELEDDNRELTKAIERLTEEFDALFKAREALSEERVELIDEIENPKHIRKRFTVAY